MAFILGKYLGKCGYKSNMMYKFLIIILSFQLHIKNQIWKSSDF